MSFTDNFLKELEKQKKRIDNIKVSSPYSDKKNREETKSSAGDDFTRTFFEELEKAEAKKDTKRSLKTKSASPTRSVSVYNPNEDPHAEDRFRSDRINNLFEKLKAKGESEEEEDIAPIDQGRAQYVTSEILKGNLHDVDKYDFSPGKSYSQGLKAKESELASVMKRIDTLEHYLGYDDPLIEQFFTAESHGGGTPLTDWINQISGNDSQRLEWKRELTAARERLKELQGEEDSSWFNLDKFKDVSLAEAFEIIGGTLADTALSFGEGMVAPFEGVSDLILHGASEAAGAVGWEEAEEFLKDSATIDAVGTVGDEIREGFIEDNTLYGDKGRGIPEAIGQIVGIGKVGQAFQLAGKGAAAISSATTGTMFASSMGSGISEAYQHEEQYEKAVNDAIAELDELLSTGVITQEAYDQEKARLEGLREQNSVSSGEAWSYGLMKGTIDAGSELIFGGLGKGVNALGYNRGLSSLDDAFAKKLSNKIASVYTNQHLKRVVGNGVEYVVKAGAEGFEEVLAGLGTAAAKKLSYMSDEELGQLVEDENLLEQFVVSFIASGVVQGGDLAQSVKNDIDFITGLNNNEQAVVDKEVEKRIEEAEKDGTKLSNKEKNKIVEAVKEDLDKGYISTDTIEEVLGGDSLKEYQDTVKSEDSLVEEEKSLRDEFNTLNRMKKSDMTGEQSDRLEELRTTLSDLTTKIEDTKKTSQRDFLQRKYKSEVYEIAKGSRLVESYNEIARRGQAFEADLSKYDEKQRAIVQKAIDSGILNNTNRSHEFVDIVAKISADKGVSFDFVNNAKLKESGFAVDGKMVNGYVTKDGIAINMDSPKAWQSTVGHEITHVLEGTELYTELQNALFEYAKSKGDYQGRLDTLTKLYEGVKDADINAELTADLVGDYLFQDADFVNNLSTKHRNVFQKIFDEIKYLLKVTTAGTKESRQLEKVKHVFEQAYRAQKNTAQRDGTNYHISENFSVEIDKALNNEMDKSSQVKARDFTPAILVENGVQDLPMLITQNHVKSTIYTEEEAKNLGLPTGKNKNYHGLGKELLMQSIDNMDDPSAIYKKDDSHYIIITELQDANGNDIMIPVKIDGKGTYNDVYIDENQILSVYGKNNLQNYLARNNFELIYEKSGIALNEGVQYSNISNSTTSSISQNSEKSSGSVKNSLSEEQQEYFKDSVVRDENGNLKVMYHGTSKGGHTVFDTYGSNFGLFGQGSYFTDSKNIAESYTKKGKGNNPQVYASYLNITNPMDMDARANPEEWRNAFPDADFPESGTNEDFFRAMEEYFDDGYYYRFDAEEEIMNGIQGMGYDGITHIGGGRVNADGERHQVYIAFHPEQIKNIDNVKPTSDPDIRYSLSTDSDGNNLTEQQESYFKNSKMRDADGNLKVMYHGSQNGGFHVFDPAFSDDGISLFFADSNEVAMSYSGTSETYAPKAFNTAGEMNSFFAEIGKEGYEVVEKDGNYTLYDDGDEVATSDNLSEIFEEFKDWEGVGYGDVNYKVYLNITNPLEVDAGGGEWNDIKIPEEHREKLNKLIYRINHPRSRVDTTTTRNFAKFAKASGYDGVIFKNIRDNGIYGGADVSNVAIAFDSNQVKSVGNQNPTSDPDIRFSLSEAVEESNDLMALHNLKANELLKSLDLGGLPMPSIAIIKANAGHDQYGDISLILPKETIDPKANRDNKVYGADAWTPTYPKIEYKPNEAVAKKISDKYYELHNKYGSEDARPLYSFTYDLENVLNGHGGEAAMLEDLYDSTKLMQAYLLDTGKGKVEPVKKEIRTELSDAEVEMNDFFINELGADVVDGVMAREAESPSEHRIRYWKEHGEKIKESCRKFLSEEYGFSPEKIDNVLSGMKTFDYLKFVRDAYLYRKNGRVTTKTETDYEATDNAIKEAAGEGYKAWVDNLFKGIEEKSGIRNNVDYFTNSGNRRKWEALHWENTLENVVRVMKQQNQTGADAIFGAHQIFATAAKDYGSIAEIKADSDRLYKMSEEEYEAVKDSYSKRMLDIANNIMDKSERNQFIALDNAMECIVDAVRKSKTKAGISKELKQYGQLNVTEQDVNDIVSLVTDISNMPTGYFEAKPMRAVGFDEVGVFVIPNNADVKLKQELLNRGYAIAEYDPNVEGDRQKVVNSFEQYKFSLSDAGEAQKTYGNFATPARDLLLETAQEDIAPVQESTETVQESTETVQDMFPDDYAPLTEEETAARQSEILDGITDEDAPPEMDAPYHGEFDDTVTTPPDPFENRDMKEVGNRKVKAYMYENPEVKPFFQEEAIIMLGELERTTKGEKWFNDDLYYETNGEKGWGGTSRNTSDEIAYLLDELGYSYAEIQKGLNAIIEDDGAENNAISKRIEFLLNDRLSKGYTDFETGYEVPPNQDYINLLTEKQISEYNDEARQRFFENADQYAPPADDDIGPVLATAPKVEAEQYEAITPKKTKPKYGNKLVRADNVTPEQTKIAEVLDAEPNTTSRKSRAWAKFKANVLDKGAVFEDLSLKTKNRELMGKWNYMLYSESRAQSLMGNGADGVKSLNSIIEEVGKTGKTKQFYEYLYHQHNADRMTLAERYEDVPNKAVFGDSVTAEVSREAVAQMENANPEFKQFAQDVYDYNNHLRNLLVEGGVISQETADLWAEMYPHYVPIRRAGDNGLNINVPLDTGRTGVNAPVKKATGGSSDILPLFDTMAMRTMQTFKAIAKNSFGVELKNSLGTTIDSQATGVDDVIDSIDQQDGLLQEGKNGRNPTFTVFENGEKVTYEITKDMYDALKPVSEGMAYTNKVLNTISNVHRGVLTEYNPVFMLTNAIKDVQDVFINSQHSAKTYAKIPEAVAQLATKGYWYKEYMANGGEQNSYFDNETHTFRTEKKGAMKVIGLPLRAISTVNNIVEMAPRLAEYIASREAGRSVEVSMLDAARVTTNFRAGGDLTKFLNRNGATFLNASVQGAMQQVRNVREANANGLKGWVNLATKFALAGLPALILNGLVWKDDEEYEELSDYVKQNYYIVGKYGDGKFIRLPKGRTLAVIQNAFEQIANAATGDDEVDLKSFLELAVSNLAPNNPLENNILSPIINVANNETWYGEDLVPSRLQDLPAAEQYDESTDAFSKWLGKTLGISPYKINYLIDQYTGGVGDTFLPMITPEAESGDNSFVGNLLAPLKSKFTTDSVMNNQNVSDFYDKVDELTTNAKASTATDEDVLMNKYMNAVNSELSDLYAKKREIQNSDLSDSKKYDQVREIQEQIVDLAKSALNTYEQVDINGEYANIGDVYFQWYKPEEGEPYWRKLTEAQKTKYLVTSAAGDANYATDGNVHYRRDEDGEWTKISDKQLERQKEVTAALGITPEEYWSETEVSFFPTADGEYEYAFDSPGKYAVAKVVGGYDAYKSYSKALYDIKADKDEDGKSISGSKKEKVLDYINNLDADYGEKIILFKSEYPADDTYNYDIIDYLNSRADISYEEMNTILRELGFTIESDGVTITWD